MLCSSGKRLQASMLYNMLSESLAKERQVWRPFLLKQPMEEVNNICHQSGLLTDSQFCAEENITDWMIDCDYCIVYFCWMLIPPHKLTKCIWSMSVCSHFVDDFLCIFSWRVVCKRHGALIIDGFGATYKLLLLLLS